MKDFLRKQKKHKDVVQISFDQQQAEKIEWENESEFRYQNEMYDLIEKKTEGNRLIIRCIPDEKETALLMDYQKTSKQNSSGTIAIRLITLQFVLPPECLVQQSQFISDRNFPHPFSALLKQALPVLPPPPDVC